MSEDVRGAITQLAQRLGYGSPEARLWICGIEEHGDGSAAYDDDWAVAQAEKPTDPKAHSAFAEGAGQSVAWRYSFELAAFAHDIPGKQFGEAWTKRPELLQLLNLLVLPKAKERDWRLHAILRDEYLQIIREYRVPFLRSIRPPGSVVVCHGQVARALLLEAFTDSGETPEVIEGGRGKHIYIYTHSRTVLAPILRAAPNSAAAV